jgi:hypothetical protein
LISLLASATVAHASCEDFLWKTANLVKSLAGGHVMQERVPLGQQLIAKRGLADHEVAYGWVAREVGAGGIIQQIVRSAPHMKFDSEFRVVDDVYSDMANFILTVPNWKALTNKKLRVFVQMDRMLDWLEKQVPGSPIPPHSDWLYSERDEWNRLFPNRPLPEALELFHVFHPG